MGQKKAVIKYNYDKPYGKWIYFYDDNTLEAYENFKDGVLFGETALFNQKGELITKVNYKEGLLDGKVLFFYGKEKIERKFFYKWKNRGRHKYFFEKRKYYSSGIL